MKKAVLSILSLLVYIQLTVGQTVILDFENAATSTSFQYFGSSLDGSLTTTVANPNPSGINTSGTVLEFVKPADAQTWAGAFSNPSPATPVDVTVSGTQVCVKVHLDHIGNLALKLENSSTGGDNWVQTQPNTLVNGWEELCFDVSLPSLEAPFTSAQGHAYTTITIFVDFGTDGAGSAATSYLDDFVTKPAAVACSTILDFEAAGTSTTFQYFGSSLDGTLTAVVANPNPGGINASAMVLEFVKPADAQTWAGAFSNPNPSIPVDVTADGAQVCVKVHLDHIGNLALKLENSSTGGANWVQTQPNTLANGWEELCFDLSLPSLEAPFTAAQGHVYSTITIFVDFGTDGAGSAATSYLDDFVVCAGGGASPVDVSFAVDMNTYGGSFSQVYISGTFNDWSADANPLDDSDGDGVWTATLQILPGVIEYKFQVDGWADQEQFTGTETCTITDESGQFTNRQLVVPASGADAGTVCWNSCYECGQSITITVNLGTNHIDVSDSGIYIAGGGNFGNPGDFPLSDPDGDGVYTIVMERPLGFESFYTFTNGNCPDYSCKENIAGQDCANPGNFNDRHMGPFNEDAVINTCFGICSDDTNCEAAETSLVTFRVDMTEYTGGFVFVYLSGTFNNWSADANPLSDDNLDNIWTTTIELPHGTYEYKFQVDGWTAQEEFAGGEECTLTTGGFTNRIITVEGETALPTVCWASCENCLTNGLGGAQVVSNLFRLSPNPAGESIQLQLASGLAGELEARVYNMAGQLFMEQAFANAGTVNINTQSLPAGLYYVSLRNGQQIGVEKFVVQH